MYPMSEKIRRDAALRRGKAVATAMKRKQEYLGARVPKELRDRVTRYAQEMGIPVSILIRNTLEEAFGERIDPATPVMPGAATQPDRFSAVVGWERIQLHKTVVCSGCGVTLQQGTQQYLGLGSPEPVVICDACKRRV